MKIFIGSDDPDTRKEFSDLCGQKKVKNFSVNTNAETPASSNTGASNQPLITVGMLESLNGDEKGDAIVSVRGYEPIWAKFTPSYELKEVYFAAGKADMTKKEARLFEKRDYVYDIINGSEKGEEEKILALIEKRDKEAVEEVEVKTDDLDKEWLSIKEEIHEKVLKTCKYLSGEDSKALQTAAFENKLPLLYGISDNYGGNQTSYSKLQDLIRFIENRLSRMKELQNDSKNAVNY